MKKKQSLTTIELQKKIIRGILTIGTLTLLVIFLFGNDFDNNLFNLTYLNGFFITDTPTYMNGLHIHQCAMYLHQHP